ncbi:MAG: glycoside hydrolase family 31 protein [Deltaproteobacteria bacterium]|nr:glycoside hydrolase family 31 protein [Deltaproteobacteria bacterium]
MKRSAPLTRAAVAAALAGACAEPPPEAPPPVESGGSVLTVTVGEHFGLGVARDGGGGGALAGGTASTSTCPPLSVALRLPTDSGKWIDVTDPVDGQGGRDDVELLVAGAARAVAAGAWEIDLQDAAGAVQGTTRLLARAGDAGFVDVDVTFPFDDDDVAFVAACFALAPDERVVGGGERFDGPDLTAKITPLVFSAPGPYASGTNEAHAPVPFFATTRGLGVLVQTERVGAFDAASIPGALHARFHGTTLPLRLRAAARRAEGPTPELVVDNVAAHARRMGLPKPPPRWALAPMQWRNDLEVELDADGAVVSSGTDMLLGDVRAMVERDLPFSTVWIDAPWETGYNTFVFNELQLPAIDDALATVAEHGLHPLVWATEHVNVSDDRDQAYGMPAYGSQALFERFRDAGYLVTDVDGAPFVLPWGRGQGAFVDFTNPAACAAWQDEIAPALDRGIRGFKLDYGESMRPDVLGLLPNTVPVFFDGSTTAVQHTRYARLYHECYIGALQRKHGDDWFVITRTGGIFDQPNGVAIWPGDLDSDFSGLGDDVDGERAVGGVRAAIAGSLSLAMSGYPLYGADVGGYRGAAATPEAFARFAEASAFQTIFQVGGGGNQAPWDAQYDAVADSFAAAARLRMSLWPMFERWLARASRDGDGTPVVVPLGVAMGEDAAAWQDAAAMLLGDVLAAFPVVDDGARTRAVRLPAGAWFDLWTGAPTAGPVDLEVPAPLGQPPAYLRAGGVLVLDRESRTLLPSPVRGGPAPDRVVVVAPGPGIVAGAIVAGGVTASQQSGAAGAVTIEVDVDVDGGPAPLVVEVLGGPWATPSAADGATVFDVVEDGARLVLTAREPIARATFTLRPR